MNKGEISDGYHTFNELYEHRHILFICLCDSVPNAWKSKLHSDGTMFDDMFIMGINDEKGKQITYHLPINLWDRCEFIRTTNNAPEWDGHTSDDVLKRLMEL